MRFGPAGYPPGSKGPAEAFDAVRALGLDALEMEFVRGVRVSEAKAEEIGRLAADRGIRLSVHAPYYISFNSEKPETRERSVQWTMDAVRAADRLGAYIVVIHAASYGKAPEAATASVTEGLSRCRDAMDDEGVRGVTLGAETMGKSGAWGTLAEIADVMDAVDGVRPVLDVAHVHARGGGCLRTEGDMRALLEEFLPLAGDVPHFHISCIKYGAKGEISHLPLEARSPDMSLLAKVYPELGGDCTFICESPLQERDAAAFKRMFGPGARGAVNFISCITMRLAVPLWLSGRATDS